MTAHRRPRSLPTTLFLAGLVAAAALSIGLDAGSRALIRSGLGGLDPAAEVALVPAGPRDLAPEDLAAARIAWAYFETNTRPETGLVDSVREFPSTTLWDQGGYVFALLAAHRLGLVDDAELTARADALFGSLGRLPLYKGRIPNKVYNTVTLEMTDYANTPRPDGIGFSALDIARLLLALRAFERLHPDYGDDIRAVIGRWDLSPMVRDGELWGATVDPDGTELYGQEGRIGYEQYAARAAALWGLDMSQAISARRIVDWDRVSGVPVPVDVRDHTTFLAITPTLSEPFILEGLELGLNAESRQLAEAVFEAQRARADRTGVPTAVSEDHLDQEPWFAYSAVHSNGRDWAVVDETGRFHPELRTQSVKAAFGWDALYGTDYTADLRKLLADLGDPEKGWAAGRYEATGEPNEVYALNTNAVVLEAIHYIAFGPFWSLEPAADGPVFGQN